MNSEFYKNDLTEITEELITEVINQAWAEGYNSYAPLGKGGDTFLLYGESRRKEISLRLHNGSVKLLVTDKEGYFLFHGGFDVAKFSVKFIADQYHTIIKKITYHFIG